MMDTMIVIVLLGITVMISLPAFQSFIESAKEREVNRLVTILHMLRNEAVISNTRYRLMFDLDKGGYFVERQLASGLYEKQEEPRQLRAHEWPKTFNMVGMALFGDRTHMKRDGVVPVVIDSSGFLDPFLLHFNVGEAEFTLRVEDFTGTLELLDGHVEG